MSNRDLWIRIGARLDSSFGAAFGMAEQRVSGLMKELKKSEETRRALNDVGTAFGLVGTAAAAAGALAVRSFANFDEAMSAVAATGDDARASIGELRDLAIDMGAKTKFNATESAEAIENMAKAGVSAKDILGGGLAGALDLAAAGNLGVAQAAEIAATTMNQFGLAGEDMTKIADVLAAAAGKAMGEVTDMAQAFKYVGPVANQMGISLEETGGAIAYLAQQGVLGDQAGTSLRGMLSSLTSPSKIAKATMDELGISVYDASGTFIGFRGVAEQLKTTMGNLSNAERDAALGRIFGNEQITTARLLYKGGAAEIDAWTRAVDDSGYAAETAAIKMDNLKGDWEELTGSLETALIGTGEGANGPLRGLVQGLTSLVDIYNQLPGPVKTAVLGITGMTAALGLGGFAASRAITGYIEMRSNLSKLGVSFADANRKAMLFRAAAGGAGVALIGLGSHLGETNEDLGNFVNAAGLAAAGFAVAGPWGAALAGGAGLLKAFAATGMEARGSLEALTATLDQQTGALTANSAAWVVKQLQDSGAAEEWTKIGADLTTVTDAILGNADAQKELGEVSKNASFDALLAYGQLSDQVLDSQERFKEQKAVLDATAVAQDGTAESADQLGSSLDAAQPATAAMTKAMEKQKKSALDTARSFLGFSDSLDDTKISLGDWIGELEKQAKALRDFTKNAETAADKGLRKGLIDALKEAGPAGAMRLEQLANASEKEIKRANKAWGSGQKAIKEFVEETTKIPPIKFTRIEVKVTNKNAISELQTHIDQLSGKTVTVRVVKKGATGGGITVNENGGVWDYYANGGFAENHVAQIAPAGAMRIWAEPETGGEAYIPLHPSKRDRSIDIWAETGRLLGAKHYANGGFDGLGSTSYLGLTEQQAERAFARALERSGMAVVPRRNLRTMMEGA